MADGMYAPYKEARKYDIHEQEKKSANDIYAKTKDPAKAAVSSEEYGRMLREAFKTGKPYTGTPFVRKSDGRVVFVLPRIDRSYGVGWDEVDMLGESQGISAGMESVDAAERAQMDQRINESAGVSNAQDGEARLQASERFDDRNETSAYWTKKAAAESRKRKQQGK